MRAIGCVPVSICLLAAFATNGEGATIQVNAGDNLQTALNAAQPGDVILLQPGATFSGNFVLPVKSGSTFITVRSASADTDLPAPGVRIGPAYSSRLPKLRSPNDASVMRAAAGAHHWYLMFLEFMANPQGYGDILQIGDGSSAQNTIAKVPTDIVVDRVYIHGDPTVGQKRGIALNGSRITIQNSYISDCKAANADAQAIAGWNGPGPFAIENNYLEGAAENVLFGGSDPAIPGLVSSDITFRRNYVTKPVSWRSPIIPTPGAFTATPSTGGSLPAGAVAYTVVARRPVGQGKAGRSTGATVTAAVPAGGLVSLQWTAVSGATDYQVFGRGFQWTVTTNAFIDTGAVGTVASPPTGPGTTWVVKNSFELKNARRVIAQFNVFDTNWQSGQAGYAIVFTPRNSGGQCPWCTVEDIEFSYNVVRHAAAGINILGHDSPAVSGITTNVRIRQNLFYDINQTAWGGNGWFLQMGDSAQWILVDHNTIDHTGTAIVYAYGGTASSPAVMPGFQFTNNIARHGTYGLNGAFFSWGLGIINAFFPGATVAGNLMVGGTPSRYPAGNFFVSDFSGQFVASTPLSYQLLSTSTAIGRATDGTNIGADVTGIVLQTSLAETGQPIPTQPPTSPRGFRFVIR
jgi:hypothetical protein